MEGRGWGSVMYLFFPDLVHGFSCFSAVLVFNLYVDSFIASVAFDLLILYIETVGNAITL